MPFATASSRTPSNGSLWSEQLAADFGLTLGQVHAALAYYFDHPAEFRAPAPG